MRRPGIDPPHVVTCVRCRRIHEWFGYRHEGGRDLLEGFVCVDCLRRDREALATVAASSRAPLGTIGGEAR